MTEEMKAGNTSPEANEVPDLTDEQIMENIAGMAARDLPRTMQLVTSMFVGLYRAYVTEMGGDAKGQINIEGEGLARNITIHAAKSADVAPGFVIYIQDQDNTELWERSSELPGVYPNLDMANMVIDAFCAQADESGFSYHPEGFKVVEQFAAPAGAEEQAG